MSHNDIIDGICNLLSISVVDLKSKTRKRSVVYARKLSIYYLNKEIADPQIIAKHLNKPIRTIIFQRNSFDEELRYNKTLRYLKEQCDTILNQ